jgi:hypothetical protein
MDKQPHLLVCISAHGYGHIAQTAPVLNALFERIPELLVTVRTMAPLPHLRARIHGPFQYLREAGDIGMLMSSALDVRLHDTVEAYHHMHRDWGQKVTLEAKALREIAPDFVLSDVGYLPLAGAHRAGIPCAGMSSLNWADIFEHYCGAISGSHHITEQIRTSYANAQAFLHLEPAMPMPGLQNLVSIGPVAHTGTNHREQINQFFGLAPEERLVLVSLGGIDSRIPLDGWPRLPGVRWLVQANWRTTHPDALVLEALEMDFSDILASSDAMICKPGYGSFVEATCSGVPLLHVSRPDWPETPFLTEWLHRHGIGLEISRQQLESGDFSETLHALLDTPRPALLEPTGSAQAADWLAQRLEQHLHQ